MSTNTLEHDADVVLVFKSDASVLDAMRQNMLLDWPTLEAHSRAFRNDPCSFTLAVLSEERETLERWCVANALQWNEDLYRLAQRIMERRRAALGEAYDEAVLRARRIMEALRTALSVRHVTSLREVIYGFHSCVPSTAVALTLLKIAPDDSCYPRRFKLRGVEFVNPLPLEAIIECVQRLPLTSGSWRLERRFGQVVYGNADRACLRETVLAQALDAAAISLAWPHIGAMSRRVRAGLARWYLAPERASSQDVAQLLAALVK